MKVENALDVQSVGDPIALNTDVHLPSALSIMKAESEVSCDFRWYFMCCFKCLLMFSFAFALYLLYIK